MSFLPVLNLIWACHAGVCDSDVDKICGKVSNGTIQRGLWTIGAVGRCLSRQLAEQKPLAEQCRGLVAVAAPQVTIAAAANPCLSAVQTTWAWVDRCSISGDERRAAAGPAARPSSACRPEAHPHLLWHAVQDAQELFNSSMNAAALTQRVLELQQAAGIKTKLVNPTASGAGAITLTGWVALVAVACIVTTVMGGMYFVYQRILGPDPKSQYVVVKSGDV